MQKSMSLATKFEQKGIHFCAESTYDWPARRNPLDGSLI
jgi:hypothetical protein